MFGGSHPCQAHAGEGIDSLDGWLPDDQAAGRAAGDRDFERQRGDIAIGQVP